MRRLSDFLGGFLFATLLAAPQLTCAAPLILTAQERQLIETTDLPNGMEFPEFFASLAHRLEQCRGLSTDEWKFDCEHPLRKRPNDIRVFYGWEPRLSKQNPNFFKERLPALVIWERISNATGVNFRQTGKLKGAYLNIVFVDEALYRADPEGYLLKHIAPPYHPLKEAKHMSFKLFIEDERLPCVYNSALYGDYIIYDAEVYIRGNAAPEVLERCIVEEIYNSMGLTEGQMIGGLFDYDFMLARTEDSLNLLIPSDFALLMMKILYSEDMKLGQSEEDTIAAVKRILARSVQ